MMTITKPQANRVDIHLDGGIDTEIMTAALEDLLSKSQDVDAGRMLYRITNMELPTLGAFAVELGYLPRLFKLLERFDKCAVVCDTGWIRAAAEVEGVLIPGLEIKAFDAKHEAEAAAWLDAPA